MSGSCRWGCKQRQAKSSKHGRFEEIKRNYPVSTAECPKEFSCLEIGLFEFRVWICSRGALFASAEAEVSLQRWRKAGCQLSRAASKFRPTDRSSDRRDPPSPPDRQSIAS